MITMTIPSARAEQSARRALVQRLSAAETRRARQIAYQAALEVLG